MSYGSQIWCGKREVASCIKKLFVGNWICCPQLLKPSQNLQFGKFACFLIDHLHNFFIYAILRILGLHSMFCNVSHVFLWFVSSNCYRSLLLEKELLEDKLSHQLREMMEPGLIDVCMMVSWKRNGKGFVDDWAIENMMTKERCSNLSVLGWSMLGC